jgi:DNA-binding MltR family transcriptional regulator
VLLLQGVSYGADVLLSRSGGLEKIDLRLELLAALGVGGAQGDGLLLQ